MKFDAGLKVYKQNLEFLICNDFAFNLITFFSLDQQTKNRWTRACAGKARFRLLPGGVKNKSKST